MSLHRNNICTRTGVGEYGMCVRTATARSTTVLYATDERRGAFRDRCLIRDTLETPHGVGPSFFSKILTGSPFQLNNRSCEVLSPCHTEGDYIRLRRKFHKSSNSIFSYFHRMPESLF